MRGEVDVSGGQDGGVVRVLEVREFLAELGAVVVVDEGDRADDLGVRVPLRFDELLADHVADELGAVRVSAAAYQALQTLEQRLFDRQAQPHEFGHDGLLPIG